MAPAEFLPRRRLDDRERRLLASGEHRLDGVLAWIRDPTEIVVELPAKRPEYVALAGRVHFFGSFAMDLVGDPPREVPALTLLVFTLFLNRRHRPGSDTLALEQTGDGRALAT